MELSTKKNSGKNLHPETQRHRSYFKNSTQLFMMACLSTFVLGCLNSGGSGGGGGESSQSTSATNSQSLKSDPVIKVSLTDAPNKNFKSIFVNIASMELLVSKGSTEKRLIVNQNIGLVDLLTLQNGILLPVAEFSIPEGVEIREIRLILNHENNHAIRENNSICSLQTPSGQQSGVKVKLDQPVVLEKHHEYSLVVDFDAKKSVVSKGNGGCLLKPVIKIPSIMKREVVLDDDSSGDDNSQNNPPTSSDDTSSGSDPGVPVTDGTDTNVSEDTMTDEEVSYFDEIGSPVPRDQLGFDIYDPSTYPDGITIEDLYIYF